MPIRPFLLYISLYLARECGRAISSPGRSDCESAMLVPMSSRSLALARRSSSSGSSFDSSTSSSSSFGESSDLGTIPALARLTAIIRFFFPPVEALLLALTTDFVLLFDRGRLFFFADDFVTAAARGPPSSTKCSVTLDGLVPNTFGLGARFDLRSWLSREASSDAHFIVEGCCGCAWMAIGAVVEPPIGSAPSFRDVDEEEERMLLSLSDTSASSSSMIDDGSTKCSLSLRLYESHFSIPSGFDAERSLPSLPPPVPTRIRPIGGCE
mmetsp:Transcript_213/g.543  ORF Transcript_213/g.543 Transcript_213/m.543 type:complete len:268 (+) Transcript_213:434-1237(+)